MPSSAAPSSFHNAQHIYPLRLHDRGSRHTGALCREHQLRVLHQGHEHGLRKDIIAQLVDEHLDRLSHNKSINDANISGLLRFEFVSVLAENGLLFKTNDPQTLEVEEVNKLNYTIAKHYMLFFIIILQFMLVILSKDQTVSRLGLSELHVVISKYDLDVNFQASD